MKIERVPTPKAHNMVIQKTVGFKAGLYEFVPPEDVHHIRVTNEAEHKPQPTSNAYVPAIEQDLVFVRGLIAGTADAMTLQPGSIIEFNDLYAAPTLKISANQLSVPITINVGWRPPVGWRPGSAKPDVFCPVFCPKAGERVPVWHCLGSFIQGKKSCPDMVKVTFRAAQNDAEVECKRKKKKGERER